MNHRVINSEGSQVAEIRETTIYSMDGRKLFAVQGNKIYRLTGEFIGQFAASMGDVRLDKATERLFK